MNRTPIDWAEYSWNPVTGCYNGCKYCYARRIAERFGGFDPCENPPDSRTVLNTPYGILWELSEEGGQAVWRKNGKCVPAPYPFDFIPTFHRYRLAEPQHMKKPRTIFVGSMCDLFGAWVPDEWIETVFAACEAAPWHRYLFLSKNPARYCELANAGKLPKGKNMWYGTTVTGRGQTRFDGGIRYKTFLSIEPLMENLEVGLGSFGMTDWIIIGAMTGPGSKRHQPERAWVENILETAAITQTPVFLKESIRKLFRGFRELPESRFPWEVQENERR